MSIARQLMKLAEKYAGPEDQKRIEQFIKEDGALHSARAYLLGVLDALFMNGQLPEEEAALAYDELNMPAERACRLRQQSKVNK